MRIEVMQLPPVPSSPNWRGHWGERYKAEKIYHDAVYYCCVDARNRGYHRGILFPLVKAKLKLMFVFSTRRRRDEDNLRARFKPGLDAIVDAALLLDDDAEHLELQPITIVVDPKRAPLTVIEIEEAQDDQD